MPLFLPTSVALRSFTRMDSRHHHESYYPSSSDLDPTGSYVDHRPFDQYPYGPTYQTAPPDPTTIPPTQYATSWDIRDDLHQTPATPSTSSSLDPTSPLGSEGDYSLVRVSAQPMGIYPAQPQVSSSAASAVETLA